MPEFSLGKMWGMNSCLEKIFDEVEFMFGMNSGWKNGKMEKYCG